MGRFGVGKLKDADAVKYLQFLQRGLYYAFEDAPNKVRFARVLMVLLLLSGPCSRTAIHLERAQHSTQLHPLVRSASAAVGVCHSTDAVHTAAASQPQARDRPCRR